MNEFQQLQEALKAEIQTANDATDQARAQLGTVTTERDTARTEVQNLQTSVDAFEGTRRELISAITPLRWGIRAMDHHGSALYRDREEFGVRARFSVRCPMRTMICTAWNWAYRIVAQLGQHMDNIVGGREFEGLTDNPASEEYEEYC